MAGAVKGDENMDIAIYSLTVLIICWLCIKVFVLRMSVYALIYYMELNNYRQPTPKEMDDYRCEMALKTFKLKK